LFGGEASRCSVFDLGDRKVRQIADTFLSASTEVVVVGRSFALGLDEDKTARSPGLRAPLAVKKAFQVVVMGTVALASLGALSENILDAEEELLRDQRLVAAGEQLALESDDAGVMRVVEDLRELAVGERLFVPSHCRSGGQPLFGQFVEESDKGVFASGVGLERPGDEASAVRVARDRVDYQSMYGESVTCVWSVVGVYESYTSARVSERERISSYFAINGRCPPGQPSCK
jgi:hypothetical protein